MWTLLTSIDWLHVFTTIAAFLAGIVVKTLLDLRIGLFIVKYFWWIRPRWIFGENPHALGGTWEHIWGAGGSELFAKDVDRHAHTDMRQLGSYCYAESIYQGRRYYFFGRVHGEHIVGEWFDLKDRAGYYGTFQLRVVNANRLEGLWMGHSQSSHTIRSDSSVWNRVKN